jgi:2',3'-cyclic-nucleotide 2'-phosphodiesterase (5'-nucleotidase family)
VLLNRIFSAVLVLVFLCVCVWTRTPQQKSEDEPQSFDERLGADDGAAMAILFGAGMKGNLDLCDCNLPRGGLARRVGYVEGFKKKFKDTPVIQVEAGFFFSGSAGSGIADLSNEHVARAYSRWPVDVINLGRDDLAYAKKLVARDGMEERIRSLPMIKNLISANALFGPNATPPAAYVIKEVSGPRIFGGKKKLRVGFVGLAARNNPGDGMIDGAVTDMFQTATRIVIKARRECDVLVIVAHCELEAALKLAGENLEADVVIAGDSGGIYDPLRVGSTIVVSAVPGNIREGDLRLYLDKDGKFSFKFRATDLDAVVPSDTAAAAFVEAAREDRSRFK